MGEGKVYMIYNTHDDEIYIGCTFRTVEQRLVRHKIRSKNSLIQNNKLYQKAKVVGWSNMKIRELEKLSCSNLELRMIEGAYILKLKPSLNSRKTGLHFKEDGTYDREKYDKEYRENNRERIRINYKAIVVCNCGREVSHGKIQRHRRSIIHKKIMS